MVSGPDKSARFAAGFSARASSPALGGRRLLLARTGWLVVAVLTVGLFSASAPAQYERLAALDAPGLDPAAISANLRAAGISVDFYAAYLLSLSVASAAAWSAVGVFIFWFKSDDRMALLTSLGLITFGTFTIHDLFLASVGPAALAERLPAAWLPIQALGFLSSVLFAIFIYLFPDGRLVPRWAGWVIGLWAVHEAGYYFFDESVLDMEEVSSSLDIGVISISVLVAIGSQVFRYRRTSDPLQRQQTKWVVFGIAAAGLGMIAVATPLALDPTLARFGAPYLIALQTGIHVSLLLIPLSIGVAILRYRLWDIDVIINRTLVYVALTAIVVGIYALVVASLGALLQESANFAVSLPAAGLVAVLFQPLRDRLQRGVNRLMYGERDDPYAVLSRLGRRLGTTLEPGAVLPTIVESVAGALKLPYAAITMKRDDGFETAAAHGYPTGEHTVLPLTYQGETIGQLILAPRAPGEQFSPADRRLLEDLAHNAEVAVHAVRLTADLRRSRERLVTTREEERRRLRRDLHDGLGPMLAGLTFGLDAARNLLAREPADADAVLAQLKSQTQDAVSDVRRLVHGLRPPALDDLGLVPAIHDQASRHGRLVHDLPGGTRGKVDHENGLLFSVEAPKQLPHLPAAVEVACFRIAQEAMTNVARHARARVCRVRLSLDEAGNALELEVTDDGVGLAKDRRAGVGTVSMCERAAELGGTCDVAPAPEGGTRVLARLPLPGDEDE